MSSADVAADQSELVAVVLMWRGSKVGLFKRSDRAESDPGRWDCLAAALDESTPVERALSVLHDGAGLRLVDLVRFAAGPVLPLGEGASTTQRVHTFLADTEKRVLALGRAHTAYRWVPASRLGRFDGQVAWVRSAVGAVTTKSGF